MARHHAPEEKAQAVGRVLAGESREQVAKDIGVAASTVKRWIAAAQRSETDAEKTLAQSAEEIGERLKQKQEEVRELLLDRIESLIPQSKSLKDVSTAYGIVTDKMLLAQGKPTSIHGQALALPDDATPEQVVAVADELRARRERERVPAGPG